MIEGFTNPVESPKATFRSPSDAAAFAGFTGPR